MKKIILVVLAFMMSISGGKIAPALAVDMTDDVLTGEGIYRLDENSFDIFGSNIEKSTENNRLYDHNAKLSWSDQNVMFKFFSTSEPSEKLHTDGYGYINAWIYNPEITKGSNDEICRLIWVLRTGKSANDVGGMYYYFWHFPMDWVGWKLVSFPISTFVSPKPGSNLDYGIYSISLEVNGWGLNWPAGEHHAYVDAMWLSVDAPKTELAVTGSSYSYGEGYVPADLGGDNTFVFETSSQISEDSAAREITVKKDGETLQNGYEIRIESDKLKIIFENNLQSGSIYDISLGDRLCDIYGNTLPEEYLANISIEAPSSIFKIAGSSIENGAEDVPLDLGGERTFCITFNNPVSEAELMQNVSVLCNGIKLYDAYTLKAADNSLYITMNENMEPDAVYTIELGNSFCDVNGNAITGEKILSFTTKASAKDNSVIWEYVDDSSVGGSSNLLHSNENNRRNKDNAKLVWGTENKMFSFFYTNKAQNKIHIDDYRYINAWIYNPEVKKNDTNKTSNAIWVLRTGNRADDVGGMYYYLYNVPMDWVGWKLVSVPIQDFANGKDGSSLEYGIYRISLEMNGWTNAVPGWTESDNYAYVDMMWFSEEAPNDFVYIGSNFPRDYDNIPVKDMQIELAYTNDLSYAEDGAVSLRRTDNDENVDVTFALSGNRMIVTPAAMLEADTEYSLTVSTGVFDKDGQQAAEPITYTFKTRKVDLVVGKPRFSVGNQALTTLPAAGTEINIKSDVYNRMQPYKTAALVAVQYDGYGNMINMSRDSRSFAEGAGELSVTVSITDKTAAVKAFITENADSMHLLRPDYSAIGKDIGARSKIYTASMSKEEGLEPDKAELFVRDLKISGTNKGVDPVVIEMRTEDNEPVLVVPIYSNAEGVYSYYYTFGETQKSGVYTVYVHTKGTAAISEEVLYFDADSRKMQLDLINTTDDISNITKLLNDNKKGFGIEALSSEEVTNTASALFEQRKYESYSDILDMITKITVTLEALNGKSWSGLREFLDANKELVLYDNPDYSFYTALSEKNQNKVNQEIVKCLPVNSFASFRKVFSDEVKEYKTDKPSSNGSGGGGGGGGKNYGNTMGMTPTAPISGNNTVSEPIIFDDLSLCPWAEKSIMKLYNKKIVSVADDKKFRPNDNVTREEYVKLIVSAFGIKASNASSDFSDVKIGAWYVPYISVAKQMDIIQGDENGSFGIGKTITRQDMTVIIYRALNALNHRLNAGSMAQSFNDKDKISDYAVEAISAVQSAGIINGFDDGSFRPLESCTRAQAAKVIAGLLEIIEVEDEKF